MKPQELRIGNYLLIDGKIEKVFAIDETGINSIVNPNDGMDVRYPGHIEPILLMDDWLIKFGFEKVKPFTWTLDLFRITEPNPDVENSAYNFLVAKFKYVHQLQNLYFDLTGDDLPSIVDYSN